VAETTAWSWQQGTMLQWLPSEPEHTIIYNVRDRDRFHGVIHNLETGEKRQLSRSFYAVCEDYAVGLNYARLHHTRPGYGYPDGAENTLPDPHPDTDGVYRIDLSSGESELIISLQRLFEVQTIPRMHQGPHWVNHLTISPDGSNFVFLNRCQFDPKVRFNDRFFRSSPDGKDLRLVHDNTYFSHFGYMDERTIVAYARTPGTQTDEYALYDLYEDRFTVIGADVFSSDGHCSFSPDRKWMLTDTYPDGDSNRTLILFEMATGRRINIGRFYSPPELRNEIRCDLHPRWSRDGRKVSIDSAHTGERQIYSLDVSGIVAPL
jgi:Tol biopolymer transport system component